LPPFERLEEFEEAVRGAACTDNTSRRQAARRGILESIVMDVAVSPEQVIAVRDRV
jgi:hypothetical protein